MNRVYLDGENARYCVAQYRAGQFQGIVSGMGKNRGTWDSDHSRRAAFRHAAALRADPKRAGFTFRVEYSDK